MTRTAEHPHPGDHRQVLSYIYPPFLYTRANPNDPPPPPFEKKSALFFLEKSKSKTGKLLLKQALVKVTFDKRRPRAEPVNRSLTEGTKPANPETIRHALTVHNTLETLVERFSLSALGMSDTDFAAAMVETDHAPGTVPYFEAVGVAAAIRERLKAMGWRAPL